MQTTAPTAFEHADRPRGRSEAATPLEANVSRVTTCRRGPASAARAAFLVSDRVMVDCGPDGRLLVSAWQNGELAPGRAAQPFDLVWPLDSEALEDLRWYLEDYLRAPYGVYGDRGARVAGSCGLGASRSSELVFGSALARDAYVRGPERRRASEVVLRSSSAAFLGLPWELMADPARPMPLALDGWP